MADREDFATAVGGLIKGRVGPLESRIFEKPLGSSDLNEIFTPGTYTAGAGGGTAARHYPDPGRAGILMVRPGAGSDIVQEYTSTAVQEVWMREHRDGAWSPWKMQTPGVTRALTTENLDTLLTPGRWGQNVSSQATAERGYPMAIRGVLSIESVSTTTSVIQTYTTGGGTKKVFVRDYYAGSWSPWQEIGASSPAPDPGPAETIRVGTSLTLSGGEEDLATTTDYGGRLLLNYGVTIPRWRIHLRNMNYRDNIVYPGALTLAGFSIGVAETQPGGLPTARWKGGQRTQLQGPATTPADGSEWVSDWFDYPLEKHTKYMLSYGFTAAEGQQVHRGFGAVWGIASGSSATHSNSYGSRGTIAPLDIWIECEVPASTRTAAVAGDSYGVGHSSTSPVHDSWLGAYCRANGLLPVFYAQSGDRMEWFADADAPKVTKFTEMARPDVLYFALGGNDLNTGIDLATAQNRCLAALRVLRERVTEKVVLVPPRPPEPDDPDSDVREAFRQWLFLELPGRAEMVKDLTAPIMAADGTLDPKWRASPSNIHLSTAGYARMASAL